MAPARVGSRDVDFRPGNPGLDVVGVIRIEVRWIDQVGLGRNMQQHQIGRQRAVGVECRVDRQRGQRAAAVDDEVESFGLAEAKAQPHVVMHAKRYAAGGLDLHPQAVEPQLEPRVVGVVADDLETNFGLAYCQR